METILTQSKKLNYTTQRIHDYRRKCVAEKLNAHKLCLQLHKMENECYHIHKQLCKGNSQVLAIRELVEKFKAFNESYNSEEPVIFSRSEKVCASCGLKVYRSQYIEGVFVCFNCRDNAIYELINAEEKKNNTRPLVSEPLTYEILEISHVVRDIVGGQTDVLVKYDGDKECVLTFTDKELENYYTVRNEQPPYTL